MEGVGHPTFRALVAGQGGLDLVCTEFVRVSRAPLHPASLRDAVVKVPGLPLSVQVMGNEADKMAEAAEHVAAAGADVVDINLGCPMPRVVRKGVGAAMLKDPALLSRVLRAMRARVPGLLSAKIRAGFEDVNAITIARVVEEAGVDFIAVHPRRRCDFYEGVADWRIIARLREELTIPVIGNGDIWYAADALRMREETGCDAVMLGRPAMRNPWIFQQITALYRGETPIDPTGADLAAWIDRVRLAYSEEFSTRACVGKLKELIRWFGRAIDDDGAFRVAALRSDTLDAILREVETRVAPLPAARLDLDAVGRHRFERSGSARAQAEAQVA